MSEQETSARTPREPLFPLDGSDEARELAQLLQRLPGEELRRRARELLQVIDVRRARMSGIVEDQAELVLRFHTGGRVTFVNRAACEYWRRERVGMLGRPLARLLATGSWPQLRREAIRLSAASPTSQVRIRILDAAKQERWHRWTLRAIYRADGSRNEFQVVARDVTEEQRQQHRLAQHIAERRRVEEKLRQAQRRLEQRVRRRTAQLEGSNQWLRDEIRRRQQVEALLLEHHEALRALVSQLGAESDPERLALAAALAQLLAGPPTEELSAGEPR